MDAAEKSLFIKFLDSISTSEYSDKKDVEDYLKEPNDHIERLRKRADALSKETDFTVGDIVIWKDGLKNKRVPNYGQPSIVLSLIDPPLIDKDDVTDSESYNVQLGFIVDGDEFLTFNYPSQRFTQMNKIIIT